MSTVVPTNFGDEARGKNEDTALELEFQCVRVRRNFIETVLGKRMGSGLKCSLKKRRAPR